MQDANFTYSDTLGMDEVPYSRGDVLFTPDVETLQDAARSTRAWLRQTDTFMQTDVTEALGAQRRVLELDYFAAR